MLPYFIAMYKAGSPDINLPGEETAVAWYRTTPAGAGPHGGKIFPIHISSTAITC
jgi:glucan endo-1,3-alpha-glucosidase